MWSRSFFMWSRSGCLGLVIPPSKVQLSYSISAERPVRYEWIGANHGEIDLQSSERFLTCVLSLHYPRHSAVRRSKRWHGIVTTNKAYSIVCFTMTVLTYFLTSIAKQLLDRSIWLPPWLMEACTGTLLWQEFEPLQPSSYQRFRMAMSWIHLCRMEETPRRILSRDYR